MSPDERVSTEEQAGEEEARPGVHAAGLMKGVASREIHAAGLVDLRGVPPEEVRAIGEIHAAGTVLGDEGNREALAQIRMHAVGSVAIVRPGYRVIVAPDLQISRSMLENMPAGEKLFLAGNVFFKPDVPPDLVAEKLEEVEILGILIACERVHGALLGRAEITSHAIVLPDDVGAVVRSIGQNTWSREYVSRLEDGSTYINVGQTMVSDDVPEELLERKIAAYYNVGQTVAPAPLLALLKARCPANFGQFSEEE